MYIYISLSELYLASRTVKCGRSFLLFSLLWACLSLARFGESEIQYWVVPDKLACGRRKIWKTWKTDGAVERKGNTPKTAKVTKAKSQNVGVVSILQKKEEI